MELAGAAPDMSRYSKLNTERPVRRLVGTFGLAGISERVRVPAGFPCGSDADVNVYVTVAPAGVDRTNVSDRNVVMDDAELMSCVK